MTRGSKLLAWRKFYLGIAKLFAERSYDPRLKVGCVIVTQTGVMYCGYNGNAVDEPNTPDSKELGQTGFIHAEVNSLLRFNPSIDKDSTMYITVSPCIVCSRLIINCKGIKEVYYSEEYRDKRGVKLLNKNGIRCKRIEA